MANQEKDDPGKDPHVTQPEISPQMLPFMKPIPLPPLSADQKHQQQQHVVVHYDGKNVLDAEADIVIHCCNALHTMRAGIAAVIARRWPSAFEADKKTPYGDPAKLGCYSTALVDPRGPTVVNLYGQFQFGRAFRRLLCYKALEAGLERLVVSLSEQGCPPTVRIATYWLGCHNAGGDAEVVGKILERVFGKSPFVLHVYPGEQRYGRREEPRNVPVQLPQSSLIALAAKTQAQGQLPQPPPPPPAPPSTTTGATMETPTTTKKKLLIKRPEKKEEKDPPPTQPEKPHRKPKLVIIRQSQLQPPTATTTTETPPTQ